MSFRNRRRRPSPLVQRTHGRLLEYVGATARVTFGDGIVKAMSAAPFQRSGVTPGGWFVLIVHRRPGGELVTTGAQAPQIRRIAQPRARAPRVTTPPIYVRDGRSVTTRR